MKKLSTLKKCILISLVALTLLFVPACKLVDVSLSTSADRSQAEGNKHVHTYSNGVIIAPTCTTGGYTIYQCIDCGEEKQRDDTVALSHDWSKNGTITEPTCLNSGFITYSCIRCDAKNVQEEISALGHSYMTLFVRVEATCIQDGIVDRLCQRCFTVSSNYNTGKAFCDFIDTPGIEVVPPTTTDYGYTTHACKVCGKVEKLELVAPIAETK